MNNINRKKTNKRMSQIVVHNDTIYLAGQVGNPGDSVEEQTNTCLDKVESLLQEAGSNKTCILQAIIWLADISDFSKMNEIWDGWLPPGSSPARACSEAKLAKPDFKVEVTVVAACK